MKIIASAMAVAIVVYCSGSVQAQGIPQGSYLQTCTDVRIQGDALRATCRTRDNREQRSSLPGFRRWPSDPEGVRFGHLGKVRLSSVLDASHLAAQGESGPHL